MDGSNQPTYGHSQTLPQQSNECSLSTLSTTSTYDTINDQKQFSRRQPRRAAKFTSNGQQQQQQQQQQEQQQQQQRQSRPSTQDISARRSDRSDALDTSDRRSTLRRCSSSVSGDSSDDGGVKYTKTGRISKALKGKRVHKCELCNKSYTRAEHLRRHQLNHGGEMLACDVAGCTRSFVREDLLLRHKEEQHDQHQDNSGLRTSSNNRLSNEPPTRHRAVSGTATQRRKSKQSANFPQAQESSLAAHIAAEHRFLAADPNIQTFQSLTSESSPWGYAAPYSTWDSRSFETSPGFFGSPGSEGAELLTNYTHLSLPPYQYLSPAALQSHDFLPTHTDLGRSKSPASTSSGAFVVHWHSSVEDFSAMQDVVSSNTSDGSSLALAGASDAYSSSTTITQSLAGIGHDRGNVVTSFDDLDASEKQQIDQEFVASMLFHGDQDELDNMKSTALESYWMNFHPLFPILHRTAFGIAHAPPLLTALMTAIGASFLEEPARAVAKSLRELCIKLLKKRPDAPYLIYRLHDLHTTFLAEAFSLYKSRRPLTSYSAQFQRLYAELQADNEVFSPLARAGSIDGRMSYALPVDIEEEEVERMRNQWYQRESKRRLFLACYVLDTQHAIFFGRSKPLFLGDVPFPCTKELWDAHSSKEWYELARVEPPTQFVFADIMHDVQALDHPIVYDAFRSAVVVACLSRNQDALLNPLTERLIACLGHGQRTQLEYHASMVAIHTPVRALLSVGGESFVLGEKLATRDQYVQAEIDLNAWVNSEDAQVAVPHALRVLQICFEQGTSRVLPEDFALYLATLVCWACTMWIRRRMQPSPIEQQIVEKGASIHEQMGTFLKSSEQRKRYESNVVAALDYKRARCCLLWTKQCIQARSVGGISEDAVNVLSRLFDSRPISSGGSGGPVLPASSST